MIGIDKGKNNKIASVVFYGGRCCGKTQKILNILLISKYMINKYGLEKAIEMKFKIKVFKAKL